MGKTFCVSFSKYLVTMWTEFFFNFVWKQGGKSIILHGIMYFRKPYIIVDNYNVDFYVVTPVSKHIVGDFYIITLYKLPTN